jgi:hypothetical protein
MRKVLDIPRGELLIDFGAAPFVNVQRFDSSGWSNGLGEMVQVEKDNPYDADAFVDAFQRLGDIPADEARELAQVMLDEWRENGGYEAAAHDNRFAVPVAGIVAVVALFGVVALAWMLIELIS